MVQMYLITGEEKYRRAAEKAGEWSARELCPTMEYRGGTCDNADVQDKEAGIYALFGFLALYDLTGKKNGWKLHRRLRIIRKPGLICGNFR